MAKACGCQERVRLDIDKKDHKCGMMDKMNQMRMERRGCDLIIKVEWNEIAVHRNVMMVGSDFFHAMFTHEMMEKQSGVVEMKDISFRIFKKCVEFIYTGDIFLDVEDCEELLYAASMLQLTTVCDNVAPFLESRLNPSSFFATKRIADRFSLSNLKKVCDDFALENLNTIIKEKEFDSLEKEYISFLITTKKFAHCDNEDSKMSMILQWIKADAENRSQHLLDFATLLDFQKISPGLGKYLADKEEVCYESTKFMKMLYLGSVSRSSIEYKAPEVSFSSPVTKSLVVFDRTSNVLRVYNESSKSWTQMQALPNEMNCTSFLYSYTAVVVNEFIYVLTRDKKAFRLNTHANMASWERISDMIKVHGLLHAVVCEDDIYVVGGHSMERYCVSGSEWIEVNCDAVSNCHCCALVVHNNFIYTIGGRNKEALVDVNRYSPLLSSWSSVAPLSSPRSSAAAVVYEDKIYVAGGYSGETYLNDFMSFDERTNSWTQLFPMKMTRIHFGLCVIDNQLFAVGSGLNASCSIEMYDFETKKWEVVAEENHGMKIMSPATVAVKLDKS